jgi:hypothetical protein
MNNLVYNIRDILTFRDLIGGSAELYGDLCAFTFHEGDGIREVTYREAYNDVRAFAAYLNSLGLSGKKIGIMGKNGYPWALTYLAVTCGVGVIVPIDRELVMAEIRRDPDLAMLMLKYLARTVRVLSTQVDEMAFRPADQRIARHLLSLVPDTKGSLRCTQDEIAASVSVSRITVSRVLNEFVRAGWVKTAYGGLTVLDPDALRQLCQP